MWLLQPRHWVDAIGAPPRSHALEREFSLRVVTENERRLRLFFTGDGRGLAPAGAERSRLDHRFCFQGSGSREASCRLTGHEEGVGPHRHDTRIAGAAD